MISDFVFHTHVADKVKFVVDVCAFGHDKQNEWRLYKFARTTSV